MNKNDVFVKHIENHLKQFKKQGISMKHYEVMCKICLKTINEIYKEESKLYKESIDDDIPNPPYLTGLKIKNKNYYEVEQIKHCIEQWIFYFDKLGRYFEKQGNQERADRHYAQAIAFALFLNNKEYKIGE